MSLESGSENDSLLPETASTARATHHFLLVSQRESGLASSLLNELDVLVHFVQQALHDLAVAGVFALLDKVSELQVMWNEVSEEKKCHSTAREAYTNDQRQDKLRKSDVVRVVLQVEDEIIVDDIDERVLERLVDELLFGELEDERELDLFGADGGVLLVEVGNVEDLEHVRDDGYEDLGGVGQVYQRVETMEPQRVVSWCGHKPFRKKAGNV